MQCGLTTLIVESKLPDSTAMSKLDLVGRIFNIFHEFGLRSIWKSTPLW